jgi:transmembrane sensor
VFSPNEERDHYWTTFLLRYPMHEKNIEEAREFLLAMKFGRDVPESLVQSIKINMNNAIDQLGIDDDRLRYEAADQIMSARRSTRSMFTKFAYPVAASFVLISLFLGYRALQQDSVFDAMRGLTLAHEIAPKGQQRHLVLEDGTQVWLNANSELQYKKSFSGSKTREVYLDGEAFFDVTEDKDMPFVVHASGLAIKVLGTAFNVKSYADDRVVQTTLVSGKVNIATTTDDPVQFTLLPNQQALFSKDSRTMALEEAIVTENYIAWKSGWMIFDNTPFKDIKKTLERWYDVSIVMEDENSLSCTFSAKFKDKTLEEVLELFRNTESISYRIVDDQVFIDGRLCEYEN